MPLRASLNGYQVHSLEACRLGRARRRADQVHQRIGRCSRARKNRGIQRTCLDDLGACRDLAGAGIPGKRPTRCLRAIRRGISARPLYPVAPVTKTVCRVIASGARSCRRSAAWDEFNRKHFDGDQGSASGCG